MASLPSWVRLAARSIRLRGQAKLTHAVLSFPVEIAFRRCDCGRWVQRGRACWVCQPPERCPHGCLKIDSTCTVCHPTETPQPAKLPADLNETWNRNLVGENLGIRRGLFLRQLCEHCAAGNPHLCTGLIEPNAPARVGPRKRRYKKPRKCGAFVKNGKLLSLFATSKDRVPDVKVSIEEWGERINQFITASPGSLEQDTGVNRGSIYRLQQNAMKLLDKLKEPKHREARRALGIDESEYRADVYRGIVEGITTLFAGFAVSAA